MPVTSDLHSSQTSRLHTALIELSLLSAKASATWARLDTLERVIHLVVLPSLIRPGPLSSPQPDPASTPVQTRQPTPGRPWLIQKRALMRRARGLGEWAARLFKIIGLIKGAWGFWTVIAPTLLWAATAAWKLISPWLRWLWQLAAG